MKHTAKVTINGVEHNVEVRDGIRYIDGMTIDQWLDSANTLELQDSYNVGKGVVEGTVKEVGKAFRQEYIKRNN